MKSKKNILIFGICVCLLVVGMIYTAIAGANDGFLDGENDSSQALETEENSADNNTISEIKANSDSNTVESSISDSRAELIELSEAQIENICGQADSYLSSINSEKKIGELTKAQITELKKEYAATGRISLKKLLEMTGHIEKEMPMITMAQAEEICKNPDFVAIKEGKIEKTLDDLKMELVKEFNKIAGAPDVMAMVGFAWGYRYYLNEDRTDYIEINDAWIRRVVKDEVTGEKAITYFFEADRIAVEKIEEKIEEEMKNHPYEGLTVYNYYYKYATDAQREELEKIKTVSWENADVSGTYAQCYEKKILKILGEKRGEMPMLTLEYAEQVCDNLELIAMRKAIKNPGTASSDSEIEFENIVISKFNEVAGAPDVTEGPGGRTVYFLDDEHTEYILFNASSVYHIVVDENGVTLDKTNLFDNLVLRKDGVYVANNN